MKCPATRRCRLWKEPIEEDRLALGCSGSSRFFYERFGALALLELDHIEEAEERKQDAKQGRDATLVLPHRVGLILFASDLCAALLCS